MAVFLIGFSGEEGVGSVSYERICRLEHVVVAGE